MTAFDTLFAADCAPNLLTDFGTSVARWPQGVEVDAVSETWMIHWQDEQGQNSGLADKITVDKKGKSADIYLAFTGDNEIDVRNGDRFVFANPSTGADVLGNASRRIRGGSMQTWLVIVPNGIDSKGARVRQ